MQETHLTNGPLRVCFRRLPDRYSHRLEGFDGAEWRAVFESVEGHSDEAWPPSPPCQQLHLQGSANDTPILFLVGQAGSAHWSASITPHRLGGIKFEIACRTPHPPHLLGSQYRGCEPFESLSMVPMLSTFLNAEPNANRIASDTGWRIQPLTIPERIPATVMWSYFFGMGIHSGST